MRGMRRRFHPYAIAVTAAIATIGGCASAAGDGDASPAPTAPAVAAIDVPARKLPTTSSAAAPVTSAVATTTLPDPEPFVSVDVAIGPTSTVVAAPASDADAAVDPFGSFAACSGLRDSIGNWSLQVSDPSQDVTAVSILTSAAVGGPGTFDASFRVEFVNGAALTGAGTITLGSSLQSGSFVATDADLSGSFACTGAEAPEPRGAGPGVELFALLRKGAAERILSLDEPYVSGATECADTGGVQVTGDGGVGPDVELEIEPGEVALRVGATAIDVDPVHTRVQIDGRAGSFHAVTADGLEIDGAFSCT